MMLRAPIAFLAVVIFALVISWFFVWKVVVPQKDQQLTSKQDVIEAKDATIQQKETTIQQLQTTLALNGVNTLPLKKRASILANDLDKFAESIPSDPSKAFDRQMEFNDRFAFTRVPKIIAELDEQGQHSDELDRGSKMWQELSSMNAPAIHKLASVIRRLANNLKD